MGGVHGGGPGGGSRGGVQGGGAWSSKFFRRKTAERVAGVLAHIFHPPTPG